VPTPSATPGPAAPDGALTARQIALHKEAAVRLAIVVEETFAEVRRASLANERVSEAGLVAFIATRLSRDGLVTERRPLVSAGANGSYPDHPGGTDNAITPGQVLLVDVIAKKDDPDAVYARTTWTAYTGTKAQIPARVDRVWKMVRDSREAAIARIADRVAAGKPVTGDEVDQTARTVIRKHKHAPWFQHAAGESLGTGLTGTGAALRAGEKRALAVDTCFTLRPAVYYPAEFGVRTEVDLCITKAGVDVTTGIRQREIRPLFD
jgi:Xaa-Pro dipeptidase